MKKSLTDRIKEEMKVRGIKIPALADQTGIPKDRIYAWYRDKSTPKAEDQEVLEKWIVKEISRKNGGNVVTTEETENKDLTMQALVNLSESNRILAESNHSLARSHEELVLMVKSTAHAPDANTHADQLERFSSLLEIIAEIGSGKKLWASKSQAVEELNKFVLDAAAGNKTVDIPAG